MTVSSQSGPRAPRPPDDLIATATSALRRLHFKTGRNASKNTKQQPPQNVPKVIVMGSSTASETTINTSTDSSNTMVTTMTATDGDNTEDSLDINDSTATTTTTIDIFNTADSTPMDDSKILQPVPVTPKTPATAKQTTPSTVKEDRKFVFDLEDRKGMKQGSPVVINKEERRFVFDVVEKNTPDAKKEERKFVFDVEGKKMERLAVNGEKSVEMFMEEQIEAMKVEARRRNSYKAAAQQDFDRIDVLPDSPKRKTEDGSLKRRSGRASPKRYERDESSQSPKAKHRHKKSSSQRKQHQSPNRQQKGEKFVYDEKHIARYREKARTTPPLPDLRVDFFSESLDHHHQQLLAEKRGSVCLNKCLREVGAQMDATASTASSSSSSPINVTANPLENPVHHHHHHGRKATIVVQQPSSATTVLVKGASGEGELSGEQQSGGGAGGKLYFKKQREENMKQLLDVTNNLTLEEIHDFEMRYGSPHHNRSQSVKTPGRSSGRPNYLCLPQQRSRVASMPNTGVEEEYYRLRHFSITGKGVVNRGDSLKSRRSRSNNSVASSNSSTEQLPVVGSARTSASCSLASSRESSTSAPGPQPYKVLMLGGPAVGKSSLVSQFMTSEYLHAYDTSIDDESGEKSVSVLLAGEESELTFIDFATADLSPESCISKYADPHAYCVVYSSADRSSLVCAERILQSLWTLDTISTKAVILVANKADLVRSRVVSTEDGKSMATSYDCKYIETSVGINHNVDELLVGILTQIRLKLENPEKTRDLFRKRSSSKRNLNRNRSPASATGTPTGSAQNSPKKYRGSRTSASLKVRSLLGKVWARDSKSKSCENLHVL